MATIQEYNEALNVFVGKDEDLVEAICDDWDSESVHIIIRFKTNVNLRSLSKRIKRFFRYAFSIDVTMEAPKKAFLGFKNYERESLFYDLDVYYLYNTVNEDYIEALEDGSEYKYIAKLNKAKRV